MKISRKILTILLALLIALSCLTAGVSAAGAPNGNESLHVTVKTNVAIAYPGDYITVTLNVTNNYYATSMRFPVLFSKGIFELVDANLNLQMLGQLSSVTGSISANTNGNAEFYPSGYSSDDYGVVLVQWLGSANAGLFGCYSQPSGQDCISFQLKIKAGANGEGTILIPPESTLFYRGAMNNPADGNTFYTMTAGQCPMTFTPAVMTAQSQVPDIAAVAGSKTVIDRDKGLIYGLALGLSSLDAYVEPVGGATLEFIKSDPSICGTGTVINVKNSDVTIKTFKVVIYGDLNGDGNISSIDAGMAINVENYVVVWDAVTDAALIEAGDVNNDGNVTGIDAGIMIDVENYIRTIDQVTGLAV